MPSEPTPPFHASRRRQFLKTIAGAATLAGLSRAGVGELLAAEAGFKFAPEQNVIPAPRDPLLWPEFRQRLANWREEKRRALAYSDALYQREDFAWVPSSFACCFLMLCDERFYDSRSGRYRVKAFVEEARREFGGFDSVVLWHAYPRIGLDDRNQFDFYRDAPGGLIGLREVVDELHRGALAVYVDYNPWDTNTRREGRDDVAALVEMVATLDVDGIFLDTMDRGAAAFRDKLDAVRRGVVLEGEIALPLDRIHDHHMSWAQGFGDGEVPGVLRNKWFERRHMQHQIRRWDRDHALELHQAWMNGSGMMIWDNVFGTWNGWCQRDRTFLRTILPIQRRFWRVFAGERWTPLIPTLQPRVYASLWEGDGVRLWTLVNRSNDEVTGGLLSIRLNKNERVWDLVAGQSVKPAAGEAGSTLLPGRLAPRGIGCFLAATAPALGKGFSGFLRKQRDLAERARWDTGFPVVTTKLQPVAPAPYLPHSHRGMAEIPAASLTLKVEFRARECSFYESVPPHPEGPGHTGLHRPFWIDRPAALKPYAIDPTLVTNAQFEVFLKASGYRPWHHENFLKHWIKGRPPAGREQHPVVYVDLDDARAFAKWARKRLPTEEEWQYAAQGKDARKYPWGAEMRPGLCNGGETGGTSPVTAYPDGRSPFGLFDMCGNVWQWTESERSDGRTRFAILRGGSFYRRGGSDWYFDEGPKPVWFAAKMLLMWPGLDRCANVGFRCAADLDTAHSS